MEKSEMKTILETALTDDDKSKRSWAYAKAIVKLGPVEELEMAQAIIDADDSLREKVARDSFDDIKYEIELRQKWTPELSSVDQTLTHYHCVAERTEGIGYKVALLEFSKFCSCDVDFTCKLLEELIEEFELGSCEKIVRPGRYEYGRWPRNHYSSVISAMAMFTQRPCWTLRHLFLPEWGGTTMRNDTIVMERKKVT